MAFHTKTAFSNLLGKKANWLSNYISRKTVILSGDYVDDTHPMNAAFLKKQRQRLGITSYEKVKPEKIDHIESGPNIQSPNEEGYAIGVDAELKQVELKKKKADLELVEEKLKKVKGETIPVDLVKSIFQQYGKSCSTAFQNEADNLLQELQKKFGVDRKGMSFYRGRIIEITNEAIDEAYSDSKRELRLLVNEYSQKRGVGERS